jgi:hypothetical protein
MPAVGTGRGERAASGGEGKLVRSWGCVSAEQGDERAAIADYTDALRVQPANAEALYKPRWPSSSLDDKIAR